MFLGTYEPKLDDKGRLILPAKYREAMAPGVIVTRGQERCLYAFPRQRFEQVLAELEDSPLTSKQNRAYTRVFLSGASDEIPDKQGRVTIPAVLRKYAGLSRDLAVIGSGTKIEIWDAAAWQTYLEEQEDLYTELTEEVVRGL
ncbi:MULTISPECIES: division/cell wall cluster transcriptional repressor MraZ [unclassified Pseudactinotalea]|uniref:division/cell wall cluster transcriptional repressor MraZ n=1 Tax=unclassified Pseudactinotalea TaxID=2649176 RepID=UPI00128D723B|nr:MULTISPECIES: division/cell wall cluster transcriptional repressor MraZ [unclassified Pseudactinotalea]MPV49527.1 division/cell wall cluster transcriptional repressor MraZ [Pseudactinotalea sp. HY160]QGH71031.1 division/cell wall cluster transcriptional repressor MraZ [Pseudactinotalea sp. HY158]